MKIRIFVVMIFTIMFIISCGSGNNEMKSEKADAPVSKNVIKDLLSPIRTGKPLSFTKEGKLAKDLYNYIYTPYVEDVKNCLGAGADPNYCDGENGWIDSNPLNIVVGGMYDTYYRRLWGKEILDPEPNIQVMNLLLDAGADINRRPYIWIRVYNNNNDFIEQILRQRKASKLSMDQESIDEHVNSYVQDVNRLLEAFIEAGADADKKGHPYPYDWEKTKGRMTDEEANKYFEQGTRPINVAIEKGIIWESQVDLLLEYVKLDEESLKAAERSNDPKMVEKINKLWVEQQDN